MEQVTDELPGTIEWFRYVRDHRVNTYALVGWEVCCRMNGAHTGKTLMRYTRPCEGEPPEPRRGARARPMRAATTRAIGARRAV